jgi:hypothetical protein
LLYKHLEPSRYASSARKAELRDDTRFEALYADKGFVKEKKLFLEGISTFVAN